MIIKVLSIECAIIRLDEDIRDRVCSRARLLLTLARVR